MMKGGPGARPSGPAGSVRAGAAFGVAMGLVLVPAGEAGAQTFRGLLPNDGGPLFRRDVAGNRSEPSFDRPPIYVGSFEVQPSVGLSAAADSNVYNQRDGQADILLDLRPALTVRRNLFPLDLSLDASGDLRRYADNQTENRETYAVNLNARYQLGYATQFGVSGTYAKFVENRGDDGLGTGLAEPVHGSTKSARAYAATGIGRVYLRLDGVLSRRDYRLVGLVEGGVLDLAYRNTEQATVTGQLGAPLGRNNVVFATVSYSKDRSPDAVPSIRRDARSYRALVGLRGDLSNLVSAELSVGYVSQNFEVERYADFSGLTFNGAIDWYARPLLSFRLSAMQTMRNSGLAAVPAILERSGRLTAFYDPLPRLRVQASLSYANDQYRGIGVTARKIEAGISSSFRLSERIYTNASIGWRRQWGGDAVVQSYEGLLGQLGLRFVL